MTKINLCNNGDNIGLNYLDFGTGLPSFEWLDLASLHFKSDRKDARAKISKFVRDAYFRSNANAQNDSVNEIMAAVDAEDIKQEPLSLINDGKMRDRHMTSSELEIANYMTDVDLLKQLDDEENGDIYADIRSFFPLISTKIQYQRALRAVQLKAKRSSTTLFKNGYGDAQMLMIWNERKAALRSAQAALPRKRRAAK